MLKVIHLIKQHPNWRDILSTDPYNIKIKEEHGFILLKYSQIDSDFNQEIVRECRGLILDSDFNPVCIPFYKFGNYGESYADKIDWNTAVVEEKLDGSLIKLWHYDNEWRVSTNGTIDARDAELRALVTINADYPNFRVLFDIAATNVNLDTSRLNPQYIYMFELVSPYNRIVTPYGETGLYHIGTRDISNSQELEADIGIPKPKTYSCSSLDDLIEMAKKLKYSEEGYVVKDAQYRRIKVKSPAYVAASRLISGINETRVVELVMSNETAEFLTYFPEYSEIISATKQRINHLITYLDKILQEKVHGATYETRKDYAEMAKRTHFPSFLFMHLDGKTKSAEDWVRGLVSHKIAEYSTKLELAINP
ncbi:MAG: hypothetical protein FWH05_03690 [Oscillospiraceae bacterium]|nr:hypothetical protein [Oscillospiraceae bacterium]